MTASDDRDVSRDGRTPGRFAGARLVLGAAAVVLIVFVALGALPLAHAAIGLAVMAAAALIGSIVRPRIQGIAPPASRVDPPTAPGLIDAVLSGLPDPVVALDRDGIVIAFNARAGARSTRSAPCAVPAIRSTSGFSPPLEPVPTSAPAAGRGADR